MDKEAPATDDKVQKDVNSFLLLVVRPGAPSSVLAPSSLLGGDNLRSLEKNAGW